MNKIYISVVSHNNDDLIEENYTHLPKSIGNYQIEVCIIDNVGSENLKLICSKNNIKYYCDGKVRGYGGNNNLNFQLYNPKSEDIFIIANPDTIIQNSNFLNIIEDFEISKVDIFGVKVFESKNLEVWSSHNRSFPALLDPLISLVFKKKMFAHDPDVIAYPDWIGGAFMMFKASSFRKLEGFDEFFFMYYEDTDICKRAKKNGMNIKYNPEFYIIHEAKRDGRKLFSKNFFMNLTSMIKYFYKHPTWRIISL